MLTVYMDESGFTGEDLINRQQPFFVHVSTTLSDDECAALHREYFSRTQGHELKHQNLSRRNSGQRRIVGLIDAIRNLNKFTVWVCHKEFTLLTYLVDLWVEPVMSRNGIDLYQDGLNVALCNTIFYCLRVFESESFLRDHLWRFQRMMMKRTPEKYLEFWRNLYGDYEKADQETKDLLVLFLSGGIHLGYQELSQIPERALNPAFTTAADTCGYWRMQTKAPISLIHDNSSSLARDKWLWDLLVSPKLEKRTLGSCNRVRAYPLNVSRTIFADSRCHLQLQFCDLVAGATAVWCRQFLGKRQSEDYVDQLGSAGIENLRIGSIWPEREVNPEKLGMKGRSGEAVDFLTEQFAKLLTGWEP